MNVFDILGPVMIGPSSSHTAGAARIGLMARTLLGQAPVRAEILLHGSFAKTYKGHGTDRALVAGILGMKPDDERLRDALSIARDEGVEITFTPTEFADSHPNTAEIHLTAADGSTASLRGAIGGMARRLAGFDLPDAILTGVETRSSSPVRLLRDRQTRESLSHRGLYPIGEGAGYAGGIVSSAIDGIAAAEGIIREFRAE